MAARTRVLRSDRCHRGRASNLYAMISGGGVRDMRKSGVDRLLAGTMLAAAVMMPVLANAAPDRIESVRPLPPSLNGQILRHHDAAPATPPDMPVSRHEAAPESQPAAAPEPTPTQIAAPREAENANAKAMPDKTLAASDAQIAAKLREAAGAKQIDRHIERIPDRKAIESFYAARNYAPVWIRDGRLTANAKSAIARLKGAEADALDPADYPVPDFNGGAEALAASDVKLTNSVLTFARHLQTGRIAPTRVTADIDYGNHVPDPDDVLKKIADARDEDVVLDSFNPPNAGFRALKRELAELRSNASVPEAGRIPEGPAIKPGTKDARVPLLREKLGVRGKPGDLVYDKALYLTIRGLQQRAGIKPIGLIDAKTIATINGPKHSQIVDAVMANMERWRWLPRDLGRNYVMVNIPDYSLKVSRDNQIVWRTKIVAGKPQTPTPLLTAAMDNVIVNPSWYVPQSIIQNELLPLYAHDPNIFDRLGFEVKKGADGHINVVQPPGAANALGRIKFNFPNRFQVYLHDTPEKRLFTAEKRAFSHGCMRVENPTKFGEVMLAMADPAPTPSAAQLDRLFGHDEKTFKMINRPMVHLTYQTAFVDDSGKLVVRDDIYGFDARIRAIMHSDERRVADIAPPPDPKRDAATEKSNQEILSRVERREAQNPFSFFDKLFR
jgi:murein L,D-transpeptidase YcbB/YkuD